MASPWVMVLFAAFARACSQGEQFGCRTIYPAGHVEELAAGDPQRKLLQGGSVSCITPEVIFNAQRPSGVPTEIEAEY